MLHKFGFSVLLVSLLSFQILNDSICSLPLQLHHQCLCSCACTRACMCVYVWKTESKGMRYVAVTGRARWHQVAKELMRCEGTCFTEVVSCRDICPPWWLLVINIITSCRGELTKVSGLYLNYPLLCQDSVCTDQKDGWYVMAKGMRRFYEDCAVNYSCWKVPFLAYNPIVNASLVFLLDSPVVYAIDSESTCCFKGCPMNKISLR